ncbi:MAG TPA: aromatic ring-hydroxylating dioxygenase subunit alpha [Ramlibacter sp.]|nr:aromatic ring-hydroxylating dioxygenase subunit alpha [Ramlibacter sp.]
MTEFPLDAWYVAAMHDELMPGELLARTFLGQPMVLFRDAVGQPRALADRCPHRMAPLSMGKLCNGGNSLRCGYHGLEFDGQGRCTHNPHGPIPAAAAVKPFAVQERHGLIWLWPGDAALADADSIPDYSAVTAAVEDATIRGYLPTACDAMLLVDNILDLSHVDYLHPTTLGSGAISRVRPVVSEPAASQVGISWISSGDVAPPAFDMHLRQQGQPTDQWTEVTWTAPSTLLLSTGATLAGEPRESGAVTLNLHLATPEVPGRCHYWYWSTRQFAVSAQANAFIKPMVENVFRNEDKPMLEAQQQRMGDATFRALKPVLLAHDAGAVRARRKLEAMVRSGGAPQSL